MVELKEKKTEGVIEHSRFISRVLAFDPSHVSLANKMGWGFNKFRVDNIPISDALKALSIFNKTPQLFKGFLTAIA